MPFKNQSALIFFRDHNATVNFKTGSMSISKNKQRRWDRPVLNEKAKCYQFSKILRQKIFQLCIAPDEVERHLFECIGYMLNPSEILNYSIVLYGNQTSGKHEILKMIKTIVHKDFHHIVKTETAPKSGIHTDKQIEYTTVIPFFGDFSMHNSYGIYHLDNLLSKEIDGITAYALSALRRLIKRGYFKIPPDCDMAYKDYFRTVDHLGQFLEQQCIIIDDKRISTKLTDIWDAYSRWSLRTPIKLTQYQFIQEMTARGFFYTNTRRFEKISLIKLVS